MPDNNPAHLAETVGVFPQERVCPFRPPEAYEQWRDIAPVVRVELHSDQRSWVVVGHAAAREALTHPGLSADSSRPGFPFVRKGQGAGRNDTMLRVMDPPMHSKYRRMTAGQFTAKRVRELQPELDRIVADAIDSMLATGGPLDLHHALSLVVPTRVICALLGVDYELSGDIQRFGSVSTSANATADELQAAITGLSALLDGVITEQHKNPRDGLIARLIERSREGEIEHRQILGMTYEIIVAGHETTANTISMGWLQLFQHPDLRARVAADPSLIPGMVEDMVRMHSLTDGVASRVATEDIVIAGQEIKAGEGVVVNFSAPNYDPAVWDRPYELDIDRNSRDHVAFSAGTHSCLGQNLARAELYTVFEQLLERVPTLRLAEGDDAVVMAKDGFVYGVQRLVVDW